MSNGNNLTEQNLVKIKLIVEYEKIRTTNAGDMGLIPDQGRSHMPWSN